MTDSDARIGVVGCPSISGGKRTLERRYRSVYPNDGPICPARRATQGSARPGTRLVITMLLGALACGCVPDQAFRSNAAECGSGDCRAASIERHAVPGSPGTDYLLGVVEFDDQGAKLQPAQMDALFEKLREASAARDLCLVIFVHGWKHNAAYDDPDVVAFRELLEQLARTEGQHAPGAWGKPRQVVGIYAGWRGQSVNAGDVAADLTFWTRKAAGARVAQGSIRELLGRVRALRDTLDRTTWSGKRLPAGTKPLPGEKLRSTRMLTIGHSFGGLVVYTALAQYFIDRAASTAMVGSLGQASDEDKIVTAYGDLVVLINPAVEATSWEPIRQIVQDQPAKFYARNQKPVLVEVTSTADAATGTAFPLGRSVSTAVEDFTSPEERREALVSVGHYPPFWTHDLTAGPNAPAPMKTGAGAGALVQDECREHAAFEARWRRNGYLRPGWTRRYSAGAVLTHLGASRFDANDPFWIVRTDASVIADHSDIHRPVFVDFVRQLYDELLLDGSGCAPGR